MKAKLSVCLIVKNDPIGLENCIKSFIDYVDEIVVVDTGSDDNLTPQIAKKYCHRWETFTDCNNPETGQIENFSLARQRSFDLAKNDAVLWVDSDDILVDAELIPKMLEEAKKIEPEGGATCFLFPYEYAYDDKGNCTCIHYRERLVTNKNCFKWVNPVHEVLIAKENSKVILINREEIIWKHQRQFNGRAVDPNRNLRILKTFVEKNGEEDARNLYYIGLEYCNVGQFKESIHYLTKYISISGWPDELAMAALKLVDIYQAMGNYQEGLKWAFKVIETKHNWGEGYFAAARMFYFIALSGGIFEQENWEKCVYFAKTGLAFPPTKTLLFINPLDRECEIHKYLNMALNKLGNISGALESIKIGMLKQPNDTNFITNKKIYEEHLSRQSIIAELNKLKEIGTINNQVSELVINLIHNNQLPSSNIIKAEKIIGDGKLDIIFVAGNGYEEWNGNSNSLGGSETMMIQLSKRLAAKGHRVRIYNSCPKEEIIDGVEYYKTEKFKNLTCDVLIISRQAPYLDDQFNIKAKLKLLWVHDTHALGATNALLLKADRILALSEWHKQNLINTHTIHPEHLITTRNGIDSSLFNKKITRNKFKCINSSSPDRSWPVLLKIWKTIKERVPKAELHLMYGFSNWEKLAPHYPGQAELIQNLKIQIKELESFGVVYHGRISQEKLVEEFESGCWIYPTWFSETSCISAMEAQAAGCRIITSSIAALNETVADRGILLSGDWVSTEYKNKFIDNVIAAMTIDDNTDREVVQQYAKKHFCLDKLADNWEIMFYNLIEELKINPIVKYQPTKNYQ